MVERTGENGRSGANAGRRAGGWRATVWLLTGASLLALTAVLPPLEGLTRSGMLTLGILLLAVVFWATEAVNASVTALIILVLLPVTGALGYTETFAGLGQSMLWRLVGILMITTGLTQTGLDRRFAIFILRLARGNVYAMLVLLVISSEILVFFVPTPPARAGLLGTVYLGILAGLGIKPPSNLGKIIFLGIPIFAVMTSASVITGASVEIYSLGLFSTLLHHDFSYVSWMMVNLPVTFLICFLVLPVLIRLFPPERTHLDGAAALIEGEIRKMGALRPAEVKMLVLFAVLMALWLSGVSDRLPAELLIAGVMFMPGVGILTWRKAQDGVPWGMIVLYGSSLALALALQQNGVVQWATGLFMQMVRAPDAPVMALLVFAITAALRLGMTNMTGVVATLFPLTVSLAASVGLNPVWLGMICVVASATGFLFPSQNVCSLITYSYGYYDLKDMLKAGLLTLVVAAVAQVAMAMLYWPLVGVPVWAR